ncbi:MAG: hypothetical protein HQL12_03745 [Candidatus Omnitrophica bacterium]|nr:hypothetical protein [Candidatus Omnitrophota bacterium]
MIINFLDKYRSELIKEVFLGEAPRDLGIKRELMDSLCVLPFSLEQVDSQGDKSYNFLYREVIDTTWAKINARLN